MGTLSSQPDLDAPVLVAAISRAVGCVGALGSRRTQQLRADLLRSLGESDPDVGRIHGPIGLDLGGNRPKHIALAICAEILAGRGRTRGGSRRSYQGPIRGRATEDANNGETLR